MKTCADCVFACVSADKETCEHFKDATLFVKEENKEEN